MTNTYMKTQHRRDQILVAALEMASNDHYLTITRDKIANDVGTATGNINRVFGTMSGLRVELVKYAIDQKCLAVIAQAIAAGDAAVKGLSIDLKRQALADLV